MANEDKQLGAWGAAGAMTIYLARNKETASDALALNVWLSLRGASKDTLIALVERGPVFDGDLPAKTGRDELIALGLAVRVAYRCEDGFQAATLDGLAIWKAAKKAGRF